MKYDAWDYRCAKRKVIRVVENVVYGERDGQGAWKDRQRWTVEDGRKKRNICDVE